VSGAFLTVLENPRERFIRKKPRSAADSVRIPSGTTTDSEPEEKRREEKRREVEVKPGSLRSVGGAA
jgi:hypothetical protein